jgi:hypothetical protein
VPILSNVGHEEVERPARIRAKELIVRPDAVFETREASIFAKPELVRKSPIPRAVSMRRIVDSPRGEGSLGFETPVKEIPSLRTL